MTAPVGAQKPYLQVQRIPTRQTEGNDPPSHPTPALPWSSASHCLLDTVVFPVFCSALGPITPWELTSGTKGGSSMWASSRLKLMFLKMGCCLTSTPPEPRQPSLSLGSLARSWNTAGGRKSAFKHAQICAQLKWQQQSIYSLGSFRLQGGQRVRERRFRPRSSSKRTNPKTVRSLFLMSEDAHLEIFWGRVSLSLSNFPFLILQLIDSDQWKFPKKLSVV